MAQVLPRYCPRCGAPIVTSSGTCAACGLTLQAMLSRNQHKPPEQTFHSPEHLQEIDQEGTQHNLDVQQDNQLDTVPTLQLGQQSNPPSGTQSFQERGEQNYPYSPAPKKRSMGRRGFMLLLVALLLVLGAIAYAIAGFLGVALPGFVIIQPPVTTTTINSSVPYADVDVTILNVQQSQSFINDPNTSTNGMVRLNLREHNQTETKVLWSFATIARLIVPDKSIVSPTYVNSVVSVAPGASQTSVVDFAVPSNDSVNQLTLVLGATNEAQMLIPLVRNANLSKYQPETTKLNGQMQYFGLNWTLTSATSSLSMQDQQAAKGMRYLTLTLQVENTLSQVAITGSPYEYMSLQYANHTALPKHATLPVAFDVGAAGVTGSVSFQVPQNIPSFTLLLEPQNGDRGDQSSTAFQMPSIVEQVVRPTGLLDPQISVRPTKGQIDDLLSEIHKRVEKGQRVLVTTLTKKMAEDLADYMQELSIKVHYLHSEIDTIERVEILRDLRLGVYDVVVGINLLREGLDLPEVSLVAILDADKEGFLRSEGSLIQTMGRAARHIEGSVIMYADTTTKSMQRAIDETNRRRTLQTLFNEDHNITPRGIKKDVKTLSERLKAISGANTEALDGKSVAVALAGIPKDEALRLIKDLESQMRAAAKQLEFEKAAQLRDQIIEIRRSMIE